MLKRFLAYYKPHRKLFIMDMAASMLVAVIGMFYPVITRQMLNDFIPNRNIRLVVICGVGLLGLYILKLLLNYFIQLYGHMMGVRIQAHMRSDMFNHLEKLSYSFYDHHETGKIMSRMTNDLMDIAELAHHGPEGLIISAISIIIAFVYLSRINLVLTLITFACIPLLIFISSKLRDRMLKTNIETRKSIAVVNSNLQSSVSGIRVTKAFNNAEKEAEKFEESNNLFVESSRDRYVTMAQYNSTTIFVTEIFNVVVLIAGGVFLYRGEINYADYSAFILSINIFINPINNLIRFMEQFQSGVSGFARFIEIMDTEPEKDAPNAKEVGRLQGHIELKDVHCKYDEGGEVLNGISLDIKSGQTYALVGPSGGGKTTICHLIPHFYDIQSGQILIDGMDINEITLNSLRRNIGIVQQDIYLFNASVRDNILYGRLDATEEEVIEAAKKANIHDYIMEMEHGYDTIIGERGVRLSGGQKQRLCIARVFLKNPPILILDEATSALDNTTEILIQQALDELCRGRTTLVVAHRLSTIKNADEIAVISHGSIIENGTHDELLELGGVYSDLYNLQFRANDLS